MSENQYMSLATASAAVPWVAPVAYAFDEEYNMYFMSLPTAKHCRNIEANSIVSVAIFDSRQEFGVGIGLQILGNAQKLSFKNAYTLFKCYFQRNWPFGGLKNLAELKKFIKLYDYRLYRVVPKEIWVTDPTKEYDKRIRVRV